MQRTLYRVIASFSLENGGYKSAIQIPTFFVYGIDPEDAILSAKAIISGFRDCWSSGTVVAVDDSLDPIVPHRYGSWIHC